MYGKIRQTARVLVDRLRTYLSDKLLIGVSQQECEVYSGPKGEIFYKMHDAYTGALIEEGHIMNVVTQDLSILLARLAKDSIEPAHGIFALAMGTGDVGWDLQSPPAATATQRSLYAEIARKTFVTTSFIDSGGAASAVPTNIVDFTTTFLASEAVGTLVEMGLVGGDVSDDLLTTSPVTPANGVFDETEDVRDQDTLCNYLTFPVINKPASATLSITWRLTF